MTQIRTLAHAAEAEARRIARADCDHMRLCSGLAREKAHQFYEANGLARSSYHFVTAL